LAEHRENRKESRRTDSPTQSRASGRNPSGRKGGVTDTLRKHPRRVAWGLAATGLGAVGAGVAGAGAAAPAEIGELAAAATRPPEEFQVQSNWDIEQTKNDKVDFFIEFLMGKNRDKTQLWLERLGKYGPMIQQKLAERGMPQDLLWLATIESGLDPNAYSKADAAGMWQFIEETGRRHGLEVSDYVDERRDPVAATDAALDYLKMMNDRFGGSWYLTAAGYNTGENRVERIVNERAGGRFGEESVYWDISRFLPSETRDYVPVMLAMGHIGKNPEQYGFTNIERQQPLAYDEVQVPAGVKLADVAAAAGVDADEVYDLNPHLVKKQTPPDREWTVRLPIDTGDRFEANFDARGLA